MLEKLFTHTFSSKIIHQIDHTNLPKTVRTLRPTMPKLKTINLLKSKAQVTGNKFLIDL